jgi:hypothetical protein
LPKKFTPGVNVFDEQTGSGYAGAEPPAVSEEIPPLAFSKELPQTVTFVAPFAIPTSAVYAPAVSCVDGSFM